jgi:sugar phosphate isomerase/epimerase
VKGGGTATGRPDPLAPGRQADRRNDGPMTRREFLAAAGASWATTSLGMHPLRRSTPSAEPSFSIGIQLYTLRKLLSKDFEGTLAALAKIGYREVEFAGLHDHSASEVRSILDRHGLRAPAGHVGIPQITDTIDQTIADAKTLGHEFVILPWVPDELRSVDGYRQVAETCNQAGAKLHAAGLTLGYHNHSYEFDHLPSPSPICGYDLLLQYTDPNLVVMELDLYWIRKGGRDALQYFRDFFGRFRLVHVKDMAADGSMTDVGRGVIGWAELLSAAKAAGVRHFLVEHDDPKDPLAFARTSFKYLSTLTL